MNVNSLYLLVTSVALRRLAFMPLELCSTLNEHECFSGSMGGPLPSAPPPPYPAN